VLVLVLVLIGLVSQQCAGQTIRPLGQFPVYSVAFLKAGRFTSNTPMGLLASAFGMLEGDGVYYVPKFDFSNINNTSPQLLDSTITWPNDPYFVPTGTIPGFSQIVMIGSGFLVPTKTSGYINAIDVQSGDVYQVSPYLEEWFYHRVRFMDVDGDGLQDIITSRATKPTFGSGQGELVWLKQPSSNTFDNPWTLTHLYGGPDFLFDLIDVNGDGYYEVAAAEFFGLQLTLTYSTKGNFSDPTTLKQVVIDANLKAGFDVHVLDVNGDGKKDLVATNHLGDGTGAVYAYEVPPNWQEGNWPRHVLASGFPVTEPGYGQAAPGAAIPFYPKTSTTSGRAWIILSGDGSQCAYELRPKSATGWDYSMTTIVNTAATVGQPTVADVNGDGWAEVFLSAYDTGIVYVYTYAP